MPARLPQQMRDLYRKDLPFFQKLSDQHPTMKPCGKPYNGPGGTFFLLSWGKPRAYFVCAWRDGKGLLREDSYPTRAKAVTAVKRAALIEGAKPKGPQPRRYRGPTDDIRACHASPNARVLSISGRMWQGNGCIYYIVESVPLGNAVCDPDFTVWRRTVAGKQHRVSRHDTLREALGVAKAASVRPSQSKKDPGSVPEGREADQWLRFLKTDAGSKT